MHRTAEKLKVRKPRSLRGGARPPAAGRASPDVPSARPANDTTVPEADFVAEPGLDPELMGASAIGLEVVAESLAGEPEPEPEDAVLTEALAGSAALDDTEAPENAGEIAEDEDDTAAEASGEDDDDEDGALASAASQKSEEPQSFLAMYFRDMAELSVLKPEQEFETARNIEELELGLWIALLGYAPWAGHLTATVESVMGTPLPDFRTYRALSERAARRVTSADKRRLGKLITSLASQIKELDIDRVFVDAALTELQRLSAAARMRRPIDGLRFNTGTKSFQDFAASITKKSSIVKRAKNEFVKANLRLVVSIARRFNHGRLPLPDLIQEGNIGLMKAVERYDYRRGFRFSTYASWWIRHAISRALADKGRAVRLPVHMIDAYHRIAKSERELQSKLERPATTEEIASVTGIEADKLEKMRTFLSDNPVSLDRSISEDDGRRLIDVLVDPNEAPSPPEQMMSTETQQEMLKLLSVLKPIEADILRKRFGLINDHERTLKEIGDEYRLSRERVRQLQEQALGKMRKAMAKREIL